MTLFDDLAKFRRELREMNRKLDQIIELLKILVEAQCEDAEREHGGEARDTE